MASSAPKSHIDALGRNSEVVGSEAMTTRRRAWTAESMAARTQAAAKRSEQQDFDDILLGKYPKITAIMEKIEAYSDANEYKMDLIPFYASLGNDWTLLTKFLVYQGFKFDRDSERGDFTGVVRWGK